MLFREKMPQVVIMRNDPVIIFMPNIPFKNCSSKTSKFAPDNTKCGLYKCDLSAGNSDKT